MIVSDQVWEYFENPRNTGELDISNDGVGSATVGSTSEGLIIRLHIAVEHETIQQARFKAYGCGTTIACASWLTEWAIGKSLAQAEQIHNAGIATALALPALKIHCAVAAEQVLKAAINDYRTKQSMDYVKSEEC